MDNLGAPSNETLTWGVRPIVLAVGAALTVFAAAWIVLARNSEDRVVATTATVVLGLATLAGLRLRRRLAASSEGLTITGLLDARIVRWGSIRSMSAPARRRRRLRSVSLEIDLADDRLIILSKLELGTDPAQVATALHRLWSHSSSGRRSDQ